MLLKKAGRPKVNPIFKKTRASVGFKPWLLSWLDDQSESRTEIIETALIAQYKLKIPEYKDKKLYE